MSRFNREIGEYCLIFNAKLEAILTSNKVAVFVLLFLSAISLWTDGRPFGIHSFIGHADQAEVANVTRNIIEGNGAVTDSVWLLHGGGRRGIPQRIGYWSLYLAYYQVPFFYLLGPTRQAVLIAASVAKLLCGFVAAYLVFRTTKRRLPALTCFTFVVFLWYMRDRVNGYSDISLTTALTLATSLLAIAIDSGKPRYWIAAGLLGGLAVGFKPSGLLFLGLAIGSIFLPRPNTTPMLTRMKQLTFVSFAFLVTITPLAYYNYQESGNVWWPDMAVVKDGATSAKLLQKSIAFGFYDPDFPKSEPADLSVPPAMDLHLINLRGNWKILVVLLLATTIISWVHRNQLFLFLSRRRQLYDSELTIGIFAILLLLAGIMLATKVHYESRYWCFIFPISIAWFSIKVFTERSLILTGSVFLCVVFIAQSITSSRWSLEQSYKPHHHLNVDEHLHPYLAVYEKASRILPKNAIVMNDDPWEFAFHTRRKCVMTPFTSNDETFLRIASRYRVTHLVLHNNVRHERTEKWHDGEGPNYLKLSHKDPDLVIYEFQTIFSD